MLQQHFIGNRRLYLRQRVKRCHGKSEGDIAQIVQLQARHTGVGGAYAQRQIGTPCGQAFHGSGERAYAQLEFGG